MRDYRRYVTDPRSLAIIDQVEQTDDVDLLESSRFRSMLFETDDGDLLCNVRDARIAELRAPERARAEAKRRLETELREEFFGATVCPQCTVALKVSTSQSGGDRGFELHETRDVSCPSCRRRVIGRRQQVRTEVVASPDEQGWRGGDLVWSPFHFGPDSD